MEYRYPKGTIPAGKSEKAGMVTAILQGGVCGMYRLGLMGLISFLSLFASHSYAQRGRRAIAPFCNNATQRLAPEELKVLRREDDSRREFLIRQALGETRLTAIENLLGRPFFERVQSLKDAFALVDAAFDNPKFIKTLLGILNSMPKANQWEFYLVSGYHAATTHSDGYREMVHKGIERLPKAGPNGGTVAAVDYGMGNGNLVIGAMMDDPARIHTGIDIAGGGLNVSMLRPNRISDAISAR